MDSILPKMTAQNSSRAAQEQVYIIPTVFKAEDKLRPQLKEVLEKYKDDKKKAAEIYSRMIAEEIVSHTSDEEIAEL